jgi:hypothetical protein
MVTDWPPEYSEALPSSQPLIAFPTPISVTKGVPLSYTGGREQATRSEMSVREKNESQVIGKIFQTDRTRLEPNVEPLPTIVPT